MILSYRESALGVFGFLGSQLCSWVMSERFGKRVVSKWSKKGRIGCLWFRMIGRHKKGPSRGTSSIAFTPCLTPKDRSKIGSFELPSMEFFGGSSHLISELLPFPTINWAVGAG